MTRKKYKHMCWHCNLPVTNNAKVTMEIEHNDRCLHKHCRDEIVRWDLYGYNLWRLDNEQVSYMV